MKVEELSIFIIIIILIIIILITMSGSSADPGGTNTAPVSGTGGSGIIILRIPSFA